jgi:endonuclease-3 related protein
MPTFDDVSDDVRSRLAGSFGPPPSQFEGLEPFEAMIAVLLERSLGQGRWRAVLDRLGELGLLVADRLAEADLVEIDDALHDQGPVVPPKALAPLKRLARWLVDHHGGKVDSLFNPDRSTDWLRGELASIKGVGMAGSDAILLYALKRPSYPVDRATYRVLVRHGWLDPTATYDDARDTVVQPVAEGADEWMPDPADELTELAHGMEQLGRRFCRAAAPRCDDCPLESLLPEAGPLGAES